MKLKINKVCDLNSISVLPPQSRRLSSIPTGPQTSQLRPPASQLSFSQGISSQYGMFSQASQLRSQPSQQSMSQGVSSQHGVFSQVSQNPLDDPLTGDQRFKSPERENPVKKMSCLPAIRYSREESQMTISRASSNLMRKWNPATSPNKKCEKNEELERQLGVIETSLNKHGIILDSVQSDLIQVNRGTKEVATEMEGIRQKLISLETSLQLLINGQEDNKFSVKERLQSISEQLSKDTYQDKLQQIFLMLSALPEQIKISLQKLQAELHMSFTKETQAMASYRKTLDHKSPSVTVLPVKVYRHTRGTQRRKLEPTKVQASSDPKVEETRRWTSVKVEQPRSNQDVANMENKSVALSSVKQEMQRRVAIDLDKEIDEGFSFLLDEENEGINTNIIDEAMKDSERILKKARRRKRKSCNPIVIP